MSILRKHTLKYLGIKGYDVCNLSSYGPNTHTRKGGEEEEGRRARNRDRKRKGEREGGRERVSGSIYAQTIKQMR